jgi:hypothetical protein
VDGAAECQYPVFGMFFLLRDHWITAILFLIRRLADFTPKSGIDPTIGFCWQIVHALRALGRSPYTEGKMNSQRQFHDRRNSIYAYFSLVLIVSIMLSCNITTPEATSMPPEAASPRPADSPEPVDSPRPSNTPRPTADVAATQDAVTAKTEAAETAAAQSSLGDVSDQLNSINQSVGDGSLIWTYPEDFQIQSSDYNTIRWQLIDSETAGDFAFHSKISWESETGFAGCGFLFRVGEDTSVDSWYDMIINRLSGMPYAYFDLWKGHNVVVESDAKFSSAIKYEQGDTNEVILTGKGNEISVYINRQKVGVWWNTKQLEGGFGFAVWANSGLTTCIFTDSWILKWK